MGILVIAVLIGLIPATIAHNKGRGFAGWWFYGTALFIIALPRALLLKADQKALDDKKLFEGMKKCPHCAEIIRFEAKVCRFCSREV